MVNALKHPESQKDETGSAADGSHDDLGKSPDERRSEIDNLEKDFAAPAAGQADASGTTNPDDIKAAESAPEGGQSDSDQVGKGYTSKDNGGRRWLAKLSGRQKAAGGGIIGLIIAAIFGITTIISGPLQFIHIAQLLQRFHFASAQDNGNTRILKQWRWAKNAKSGTIENTRLGIVGRRVAVKIDTTLKDYGIEKHYGKVGNYEGTYIDAAKFSENSPDGDIFKRIGEEDFAGKFKETYGVGISPDKINTESGLFKVDEDGLLAYFKNRKLNKSLVGMAGHDNLSASISARIMGKRDGITLHPIKKLDAKITSATGNKLAAWFKQIKDRIKNGATDKAASAIPDKTATDADGNPDKSAIESNKDGARATNDFARESTDALAQSEKDVISGVATSSDDVTNSLTSKLKSSGNKALGAAAVIAIACAIKGIANAADNLKHDLVVLPLVRTAMQAISVGNQVMSGQDIDAEQLGFYAKQLNDPKTGSWASARSIQAEQGQELTGPDMPDSANPGKIGQNMFSQILDKVPVLTSVCKVANSFLGTLAMTVVGVVTAPVSSAGQFLVVQSGVLNGPMASLVRWMAGSPIPTFVTGPTYGNYINYGAKLAANDSMASMGGAKLTSAQSAEIKNYQTIARKQDVASQSVATKILDPYSPDSLVGKAIDNQSSSYSSNLASFFGNILNPLKSLAVFKLPFNQKINAATSSSYDYGFPEIGFSLADMESPTYDDPYDNASKAISLLADPTNGYASRIEKCFGMKFVPSDGSLSTEFSSIDVMKQGEDSYDSNNCADTSQNWTRIRFYVLDMKTAEAADCFDSGDSQSCRNSGFGDVDSDSSGSTGSTGSQTTIVGDLGESSDNVLCASGTKDLGVVKSLYTGILKKTVGPLMIRLCQVPDIAGSGNDTSGNSVSGGVVVNSRVSGAWQALGKAAKADGVSLSADSSFRLAHSCNGTGDGTDCARPGQSIHQLGVAIDFSMPHKTGPSTTACGASRARLAGNPMWDWLYPHAEKYGFKQYTYEVWHWDALNSANRCGTND